MLMFHFTCGIVLLGQETCVCVCAVYVCVCVCVLQGLFARKRMLLLTEGPHLYYVDYTTKDKVVKGQIPW